MSDRKSEGPTARTPQEERAYQLGCQAGSNMTDALEAIMEQRFKPVFEGYLDVLRKHIHGSFSGTSGPPITVARAYMLAFVDNVDELRKKMTEEIYQRMEGWVRLINEMNSRTWFDAIIAKRVDEFLTNLLLAGKELLLSYAGALKDAEDAWRRTDPRAAEFPVRRLMEE